MHPLMRYCKERKNRFEFNLQVLRQIEIPGIWELYLAALQECWTKTIAERLSQD